MNYSVLRTTVKGLIVVNFFLVLILIAVLTAKFDPSSAYAATPDARVTVDTSVVIGTSNFNNGVTHDNNEQFIWNDNPEKDRVKDLLRTSTHFQNQHIMGWGALNPEPTPGVYDWETLDYRIQLIRDSGGEPVITLCCAPGWMRSPGYEDDWAHLDIAPAPSHVADFAELTKQVALRYPDVKYFQVWNELKGMWATSDGHTPGIENTNRWDYERYVTLYNAVYDAVKSVRPDAKIGGPYVVIDSYGNKANMSHPGPTYSWGTMDQRVYDVISYWLANKRGADFITVDGSSSNWRDQIWVVDEWLSAQKFVDVYNWIKAQPGTANLPVWWAEWYAWYPSTGPSTNVNYLNAIMANGLIYTARSGAFTGLVWQAQGDAQGFSFPLGLWTDANVSGGGQATPFYNTQKAFKDNFGPGTLFYKVTSTSPNLEVLASQTKAMVVNKTNTTMNIEVNGIALAMSPYQVSVVSLAQQTPTPTTPPTATPTSTPTPMPSTTAAPTPTKTPTPSPTRTPTPSRTPTPAPDTTKPSVSITAPTGSTVRANTSVMITANATDNVGVSRVIFSVNNTVKCTDYSAPYGCTWQVPRGRNNSYTIKAQAYDAAGNAQSVTKTVTSR